MQNLYPLFERNRVLKKELLWALRDCSSALSGVYLYHEGGGAAGIYSNRTTGVTEAVF